MAARLARPTRRARCRACAARSANSPPCLRPSTRRRESTRPRSRVAVRPQSRNSRCVPRALAGRNPPLDRPGLPRARSTRMPRAARSAATTPPPAPEPTTQTSHRASLVVGIGADAQRRGTGRRQRRWTITDRRPRDVVARAIGHAVRQEVRETLERLKTAAQLRHRTVRHREQQALALFRRHPRDAARRSCEDEPDESRRRPARSNCRNSACCAGASLPIASSAAGGTPSCAALVANSMASSPGSAMSVGWNASQARRVSPLSRGVSGAGSCPWLPSTCRQSRAQRQTTNPRIRRCHCVERATNSKRIARPLESTTRDLDPLDRCASATRASCCSARRRTAPRSSTRGAREISQAADRGARLLVHRRRGRLARLLPRQSLRESTCRTRETARGEVLHAFERWPTWMWANREVVDLVEWLREHNRAHAIRAPGRILRARRLFALGLDARGHGLSASASIPSWRSTAQRAYNCFEPYAEDVQEYARATAIVPTSCEDEAVAVLRELRVNAPQFRERWTRRVFQRRAERARREERRAVLPDDGARRAGVVERARPPHGRDARPADAASRSTRQGDRLGAQHARRRRALHRHGARRDGERRPARAAERTSATVCCWSASARIAARSSPPTSGARRWSGCASRRLGPGASRRRCTTRRLATRCSSSTEATTAAIAGLHEPIGHRAIGVVYDPDARALGELRADDRAAPLRCVPLRR